MQNPPSYLEVMSHQNGEDTPPPSYDEVVRPDSPEPQPPIIEPPADRKPIDPFVVPQQEDMSPPIPVSDTDQKITHNRNRQELLLAQDQKQNGLSGAISVVQRDHPFLSHPPAVWRSLLRIIATETQLNSLKSATDLLLEAISLAISHTSCAEKTNKLQVYVEAIGRIKLNQRYLTCDQWSAAVDSLKVICDSAKALICAHRNFAMNALTLINLAPTTSSYDGSKSSFDQVEALLSELMPREDHGHSESLSL